MTPEGRVKAAIKRWLHARGWWYFMPVSSGMGKHGIHDFIVCEPVVVTQDMVGQVLGRFRSIEAKAPGGNPTDRQTEVAQEIRAAGGLTIVCSAVSQLDEEWQWPTPVDPSAPRTKRRTTRAPRTSENE